MGRLQASERASSAIRLFTLQMLGTVGQGPEPGAGSKAGLPTDGRGLAA